MDKGRKGRKIKPKKRKKKRKKSVTSNQKPLTLSKTEGKRKRWEGGVSHRGPGR